ncbi:MAG: cytochrome d ubiquinol oxidase subunit II [Solirubrobacteraceae bacterium]|nr:cytochrome d ubiquinol oxidase subunit II [Patulibacter sp.]
MADVCAALLCLGLTAYVVMAGADFGAGFWDLTAGGARRGGPVRGLIQRSMSPVWEANHVWLIFIFTLLWTAFPVAFASAASTLYVPLTVAAIGIIFRGTAFALRGEAATIGEARVLGGLFATSSVLVPFAFGSAVGAVASGRVPVGNAAGDPITSWLSPTGVLIGLLSVATGAYLAAVFLCADAERAERPELIAAFRRRAYGSAVVAGGIALVGLLVLRADARPLFDDLTAGWGLVLVLCSAACGVATLLLLRAGRVHAARYSAAGAVAFLVAGWAVAQSPDLLPGALTIDQGAAGRATLEAALISAVLAVVILGPSLWLLFRLVLSGTLDQEYAPLDQRFRPLDPASAASGDAPPPGFDDRPEDTR